MLQLKTFLLSVHRSNLLAAVFTAAIILGMASCEKEISVEVPDSEAKLVIEGRIESDGINPTPPFITLTKTVGYFETTDLNALASLQVHDAQITVTVDNITYPLEELCVASLDPIFKPFVAEFLGVSVEQLDLFDYCVYTVPLADLLGGNFLSGEIGKTYYLEIISEGVTYTSYTKIPNLNTLSDVWYMPAQDDTFGYAWARMADPDTSGDAYRWYAKRISVDNKGNQKDDGFIAPAGSAFEDKFINGIEFDFAYDRGHAPGDHSEADPSEIPHFFKRADTIVIKFCTIDLRVYNFLRTYEIEVTSAGSPFASPSTIPTNIVGGGVGLWAGYGATYDTIFGVK